MTHEHESAVLGRRELLTIGAGIAGTAGVRGALHAAGGSAALGALGGIVEASTIGTPIGSAALAASAVLSQSCVLSPEESAGPYYLPIALNRRDITEGQAGTRLTIFVRIVRASDCSPVPGAAVDIWHTDAAGDYSGFAALGTGGASWLRGYQVTPASGIVRFESIYPGWYPMRTAHVHLKVYPGGPVVFTTQLYFPDHVSDATYLTPPYAVRGPKPHSNAADMYFHPETVFGVRELSAVSLFGAATKPGPKHLYVGLTIGLA